MKFSFPKKDYTKNKDDKNYWYSFLKVPSFQISKFGALIETVDLFSFFYMILLSPDHLMYFTKNFTFLAPTFLAIFSQANNTITIFNLMDTLLKHYRNIIFTMDG